VEVSCLCEGLIDEIVLRHIAPSALKLSVEVTGGKVELLRRLPAYAKAAQYSPFVVLLDLDMDGDCAPTYLRDTLELALRPAFLCIRIPVRAIESWFIADTVAFSTYFGLRRARVTTDPESLDDPKGELIRLVSDSSKTSMKRDVVPVPGSQRRVGRGYTSAIQTFVQGHWDISKARTRSHSLDRALVALGSLSERLAI